jgi:seryl-tRNA synthetase
MVLNIDLFREDKGGNPDKMRKNQTDRYKDPKLVDNIVECDDKWRKLRFKVDNLKKLKNQISKVIGQKMKNKEGKPTDDATLSNEITDKLDEITTETLTTLNVAQCKAISKLFDDKIEESEKEILQVEYDRNESLKEMGNILHESVPITDNEDFNRVERTKGDCETKKKWSHVDLVEFIDGVDSIKGANVSGSRGYFAKGPVVFLQQAVINLALQMLDKKDYTPLYTPFFMRKEVMQEVAQLSQFDDELYKVVGKSSEDANDKTVEEKYLIATSEQPIAAFHRDEWIPESSLPLRYCGTSTCFRLVI